MMGLSLRRVRSSARSCFRLSSAHQAHVSIVQGILLTLSFVAVGRLAGAGREMAIAAQFGASNSIDGYVFAFNMLSWPFSLWFSLLVSVLVPTVMRLRQDHPEALQRFGGGVLSVSLTIGVALWVVMWLVMTSEGFLGIIGFPPATQAIIRDIAAPLALLVPVGFLISFFSAWIMAAGRYWNTLFEAVPPFVTLIFVLVEPAGDLHGLVWGTLTGFALHLLLLVSCVVWAVKLRPTGFRLPSGVATGFWTDMAIMGAGQSAIGATLLIDQIMAAPLVPGSIAILGYSSRLIALILSVGALTISRATLPVFSAMRASQDIALDRITIRWTQLVFLAAGFTAMLSWWFAPTIVAAVFERGAFSSLDTQAVATTFSFGLVQVPFYCAGLVLTSRIIASRRYGAITAIGVLSIAVKAGVNLLLIPELGAGGIMLASGIMYAASFAAMAFVVLRIRTAV